MGRYERRMKFGHALGFLSIGLVMLLVQQFAPGLCPPNGFDGSSGRALWLGVMGTLQLALGGGGVAWHAVNALVVALETLPEAVAEALGEAASEVEELALRTEAQGTWIEFEPKPDWDQQRAA